MGYVKCDACEAVHESALPVCPGCGRCPSCGERRLSAKELEAHAACPECELPYCKGCGRCHQCAATRFADWPACSCGFPTDPEKIASVEKHFGLGSRPGCLGAAQALVIVALILAIVTASHVI